MGAALLAAYTGAQGAQPTIDVKLARPATAAGTPPILAAEPNLIQRIPTERCVCWGVGRCDAAGDTVACQRAALPHAGQPDPRRAAEPRLPAPLAA